jgi:hypothetical protein
MPHVVVGGPPFLGDSTVLSACADQGSSSHLIALRTNQSRTFHFGSHRIGHMKSDSKQNSTRFLHFVLKRENTVATD